MQSEFLARSAVIVVLASLTAGDVRAALIRQPADLNPGEEYRLVFTTSNVRDAVSTEIADYNMFVQATADAAPVVGSWGMRWTAIASTSATAAIDNTMTNGGLSVPIYSVDGTRIADGYGDLWDGDIDNPISVTELGAQPPASDLSPAVWTGTSLFGAPDRFLPLGSSEQASIHGAWSETSFLWLNDTAIRFETELPLYAMSEVLVAVPEATTILWPCLIAIAFAVRPKRRFRS